MKHWQQRISYMMAEREWDQYDLAAKTNYSQGTIHNILRNKEQLTVENVRRLCNAFGCTEQHLLYGMGNHSFPARPILTKDQIEPWLVDPSMDTGSHKCVAGPLDAGNPCFIYGLELSVDESMPGLSYGSIAIVDPGKPLETGNILVCRFGNSSDKKEMVYIRRLIDDSGDLFLKSIHDTSITKPVPDLTELKYLGTVIGFYARVVRPDEAVKRPKKTPARADRRHVEMNY